MATTGRLHTRPAQRILLITAAAVPLTGWTLHAAAMHRRLARVQRDPLTGAHRRETFTRRAQQLLTTYGDSVLVAMVDLDHFKPLNDQLGHQAGDQALAATGYRLATWAGNHGVVGRLGGDEFAVATRISPTRRQIRLDQLARVLAEPITTDAGQRIEVTASVGAAAPDTIGNRSLPVLLRAADTAMYARKHTGQPHLAGRWHATTATVNGRRLGRPGTHHQVVTAA